MYYDHIAKELSAFLPPADPANLSRRVGELLRLLNSVNVILLDGRGEVRFWPAYLEEKYAVSKQDACGRRLDAILDLQLAEGLDAFLAALFRTGIWSGKMRRRAAGREFVLQSKWICLPGSANGDRLVAVDEADITDQEHLEVVREHAERILQHDIRSALSGIVGLTDLLRDKAVLDDEDRLMMDLVNESARRCTDLIGQSLLFYRLETGTYAPRQEVFDLAGLVRSRLALRRRDLQAKGLEVRVRVDGRPWEPGVEVRCRGDLRLLEILFGNLLGNAAEACPRGGTIEVDIDKGGGRCLVSIRNGGCVPAEIRDRFMEKFVTAGKRFGTGLGAYSARIIAAAHGSELRFETSESAGTRLWFELPLAEPSGDGTRPSRTA